MFQQHDIIAINKDIAIPNTDGEYIPAGTKCTIVLLYRNPKYIEIEYDLPEHRGTITIDADNDIIE